ncbi:cell envelope integrity protein TolA [Vibrio tritonius]|uniref:cell envelope integrity protein TolA n=1 Tax=Vibrio tritonius TaxID=1435069 RepID=UPI00315CD964
MKTLPLFFSGLIIITSLSHAETNDKKYTMQQKQQKALDEIFSQLEPKNETESQKYGVKTTKLIQERLGDLKNYQGLECHLQITLSPLGKVTYLKSDDDNILCEKTADKIWSLTFEMPSNFIERQKMQQMHLSILP